MMENSMNMKYSGGVFQFSGVISQWVEITRFSNIIEGVRGQVPQQARGL